MATALLDMTSVPSFFWSVSGSCQEGAQSTSLVSFWHLKSETSSFLVFWPHSLFLAGPLSPWAAASGAQCPWEVPWLLSSLQGLGFDPGGLGSTELQFMSPQPHGPQVTKLGFTSWCLTPPLCLSPWPLPILWVSEQLLVKQWITSKAILNAGCSPFHRPSL